METKSVNKNIATLAYKGVQSRQNHVLSAHKNQLRLLKYSLIQIMQTIEYNFLKDPLISSNPMVNTVGLNGIANKFDNYLNCDEFLADIKQLVQSYSIQYAMEPGVKTVLDTLNELCNRNVNSIRTCAECFENWINDPHNYFSNVCNNPHLIIYAKAEGFPYWPSKLMSINGNMANVAFFGDHTQADVPLKKCILYAKRNPIQNARPSEFTSALEELNVHIKKIKEKFGSFNPADSKILLDSKTPVERHLMEMIPGAFAGSTSTVSQKHHDVTTKENVKKPHEAQGVVREIPTTSTGSMSANQNTISTKNSRGGSILKRPAQNTPSTEQTPPTKKVARNVVGDDIQKHFEALSRRVVELEDEKNLLQQEVKTRISLANASAEKYKQRIRKLEDQLVFSTRCAFCNEDVSTPLFCNRKCEMYYDPADDPFRKYRGLDDDDDNDAYSDDNDDE